MTKMQLTVTGLTLLVLISGLQVVNAIHLNRQAFVQMQELKKQQDKMETEWGQLQLEQATWAAHGRVEKIANHKLGMRLPPMDSVLIIQP
ncbi:MAG: cell division protein FtsL [Gammaproteobacteria bacterium]|jgi:cell division protein FtsL